MPRPRFRIYTRPDSYATLLGSWRALRNPDARAFEDSVKSRLGCKHALAMPQARVGLYFTFKSLLRQGQEVVLSPYTIFQVVNAVICAGGVPVFADIDPLTCNLSSHTIEPLLSPRTAAVLVTHLHGLAAPMAEIGDLCRARGVPLVEDAAQAFGSRSGGREVGTFGRAGVFSFGMYKHLTTFLGGMVVTDDSELYQKMRMELESLPPQALGPLFSKAAYALMTDLATWPPMFSAFTFPLFRFAYLHNVEILNKQVRVQDDAQLRTALPAAQLCRMTEAQARIGVRGLAQVERDIARRVGFAQQYAEGLGGLDLSLPPLHLDGTHTYTYYPVQYGERQKLVRYLMTQGCDLAIQHLKNCAEMECFRPYARDCPAARRVAQQTLLLPTYPRYSEGDARRNIGAIRRFFGKQA